jgi:hypothetical protein
MQLRTSPWKWCTWNLNWCLADAQMIAHEHNCATSCMNMDVAAPTPPPVQCCLLLRSCILSEWVCSCLNTHRCSWLEGMCAFPGSSVFMLMALFMKASPEGVHDEPSVFMTNPVCSWRTQCVHETARAHTPNGIHGIHHDIHNGIHHGIHLHTNTQQHCWGTGFWRVFRLRSGNGIQRILKKKFILLRYIYIGGGYRWNWRDWKEQDFTWLACAKHVYESGYLGVDTVCGYRGGYRGYRWVWGVQGAVGRWGVWTGVIRSF